MSFMAWTKEFLRAVRCPVVLPHSTIYDAWLHAIPPDELAQENDDVHQDAVDFYRELTGLPH